jgi:hypothetical protein
LATRIKSGCDPWPRPNRKRMIPSCDRCSRQAKNVSGFDLRLKTRITDWICAAVVAGPPTDTHAVAAVSAVVVCGDAVVVAVAGRRAWFGRILTFCARLYFRACECIERR